MNELIIIIAIVLYVAALVVTGMKGRWVLLGLGIFFGIFAIVGAFMPARPGSAWANRRGSNPAV